jgi:hypothetical protein
MRVQCCEPLSMLVGWQPIGYKEGLCASTAAMQARSVIMEVLISRGFRPQSLGHVPP